MRRASAVVLVVTAIAAGCGDDDDEPAPAPAESAPAESAPARPAEGAAAPDRKTLTACLADAGLELTPGSVAIEDEKGQKRTRKPLSGAEAEYTGYVQWDSKRVADVYLAADEARAEKIESEARAFVQAFGLEPDTYVRRAGAVVMTFDDPPPSDEEAKQVEACAGGG